MRIDARLLLDVADVLIVAFLFYRLLVLVRGTRAAQMVVGLAVIAILSVLAEVLELSSLDWLFGNLRTAWVIGFLVVFQPELRRGLSQLGQSRLFKRIFRVSETAVLGELQKAVDSMAGKGHGGLLVIERNVGLRVIAETGTAIEALVSAELIETIFTPPSPLHDGATILRGNQVVAAGCILPLSQDPLLERTLGTRHRAAVGLSEETDAIVIAVSEESRQVSVAEGGALHRLASSGELRAYLAGLLVGEDGSALPGKGAAAEPVRRPLGGEETPPRP